MQHGGNSVTLHEVPLPTFGVGRASELFLRLGGSESTFNATRVGAEIASHRFATGGVPIDVRPVAEAISLGCLAVNSG